MSIEHRESAAPGGQPVLDELKRSYRAIAAPPGFAARVTSRLPGGAPRRSWVWRPVVATAALALVLVVVGPRLRKPPAAVASTIPSLARLADGLPNKPATRLPSLVQVTGLTTPAVPKRPRATQLDNPRSQPQEPFFQNPEENNHG